jgi:hypothetical protein
MTGLLAACASVDETHKPCSVPSVNPPNLGGDRESVARLQRLRAHEAEAPELQHVTGHDGVVRSLADPAARE